MKLPPDGDPKVVARGRAGDVDFVLTERVTHREAFTFTTFRGETLRWDVTAAKAAVAAGQVLACPAVDAATMREIMANNEWTEAGVAAADPARPGIAAPLVADGEVIYVLIDGVHRCVRALRDGRPFSAWLLTDAASRACLIDGPEALVP